MRFSLAALLWLTTCCSLLSGWSFMPPYFLRHYRIVNLNTAKVFTFWPVEAAGRVALVAALFFVGLRLIRNRYDRSKRSSNGVTTDRPADELRE
jgi:hypothetical protein